MGEHRLNPVAQANAAPQRRVAALDLGEGYALAGCSIEPVLSMEPGPDNEPGETKLAVILTVVGGRRSDLVPMVPVKLVLGELASIPLSKLRERLAKAIEGEQEPA